MAAPRYAAGFHFVVNTPAQTLDKHERKAIRSHATKAGVTSRQHIRLQSWLSPARELGSTKTAILEQAPTPESIPLVPSPRWVGAQFSGLQLPSGVEPYMIQDLVTLIDLHKHGVYPYEICFDVHIVQRGWFPYMISDICCLHSMMFSAHAVLENALHNQLSGLASFHYMQTLQHLQARLNEFDQTSAISDSTIMVVITLATVAELLGDSEATANHIKGLEKIVILRGGVRKLDTHNNIQVKVCRADLAYALSSGHPPRLFKEEISWKCFIADRGLIQCSHQPHEATLCTFIETTMDRKLQNILKDVHAFSCISNLAYQTTRKISPDIYNEIMISILYRLTNLSFENDSLQEVIRIGLLVFASTMYMQRNFMEKPNQHLPNLYRGALVELRKRTDIEPPAAVTLWLTMLAHVTVYKELPPTDWRSVWLKEAIYRADINSWPEAREMLRSFVWVDFIHDRLGKLVFEAAIL